MVGEDFIHREDGFSSYGSIAKSYIEEYWMKGKERTYGRKDGIIMPEHTNEKGNAFGGKLVADADKACAIAARRFASLDGSKEMVTTASLSFHFGRPLEEGEVYSLEAEVSYAGTHSMVVQVTVEKDFKDYDNEGGNIPVGIGRMAFVAIDEKDGNRRKIEVPDLKCRTFDQRKLYKQAREWKKRQHEGSKNWF